MKTTFKMILIAAIAATLPTLDSANAQSRETKENGIRISGFAGEYEQVGTGAIVRKFGTNTATIQTLSSLDPDHDCDGDGGLRTGIDREGGAYVETLDWYDGEEPTLEDSFVVLAKLNRNGTDSDDGLLIVFDKPVKNITGLVAIAPRDDTSQDKGDTRANHQTTRSNKTQPSAGGDDNADDDQDGDDKGDTRANHNTTRSNKTRPIAGGDDDADDDNDGVDQGDTRANHNTTRSNKTKPIAGGDDEADDDQDDDDKGDTRANHNTSRSNKTKPIAGGDDEADDDQDDDDKGDTRANHNSTRSNKTRPSAGGDDNADDNADDNNDGDDDKQLEVKTYNAAGDLIATQRFPFDLHNNIQNLESVWSADGEGAEIAAVSLNIVDANGDPVPNADLILAGFSV